MNGLVENFKDEGLTLPLKKETFKFKKMLQKMLKRKVSD